MRGSQYGSCNAVYGVPNQRTMSAVRNQRKVLHRSQSAPAVRKFRAHGDSSVRGGEISPTGLFHASTIQRITVVRSLAAVSEQLQEPGKPGPTKTYSSKPSASTQSPHILAPAHSHLPFLPSIARTVVRPVDLFCVFVLLALSATRVTLSFDCYVFCLKNSLFSPSQRAHRIQGETSQDQ